ncbi:hypothetical protein HS088_TW11G00742 [Tripterygium wilfordii]|uniref:HXXXD-type acyl-transferase family protein n=1 Tax=Tripterygium wilfordii TaxID=458696 RepID=A0A7J7D2U0_TRIWF|nr:uncharacterized acetyltransferase At3g50280-like [Tripterygium wilfordii]KAF5740665.1 hypothetical protein HS088_TW11G00742 [Tripterygium wilfordii]
MSSSTARQISECFIKPVHVSEEMKQPLHLTPWDLSMLSAHYIQKGILFTKPPEVEQQENFMESFLDRLKQSLYLTLLHFYPLASRFATTRSENPHSHVVFVDCNNIAGARFIHAALDMKVSDILSPNYVPVVVQSFFDLTKLLNYDGHTTPLLSIQVTELIDGIFIGCSMNHAIADGTSFWNFFNLWSEIFEAGGNYVPISHPSVFKPWFSEGQGPMINLPFKHPDEFIRPYESPELKERIFHFTAESLAKLKAQANAQSNTSKISSFQSVSALFWRSITRIRNLPPNQITSCRLAANNRTRLNPPLSRDYFGNSIITLIGVATVGELLEHDLGWAAWKLHQAVVNYNDKHVRDWLDMWLQSPFTYQLDRFFDPCSVMMGHSPRFNVYGNGFGLGKPVAVRSGYANKFDGKATCYPGQEGGGSIDLEVCLLPNSMTALESDEEFMTAAFL